VGSSGAAAECGASVRGAGASVAVWRVGVRGRVSKRLNRACARSLVQSPGQIAFS